MAKWAINDKVEFEARQAQFDFAIVARTVLDLTINLKKRLGKMFQAWKKGFRTYVVVKKPHQLVLELDGVAQIPMIFP